MSDEQIQSFKEWLHNNGAQVLDPTNDYELVRFRNANGIGVIYEGKRGLSFTGESAEGWRRFKRGENWKIVTRKRRNLSHKKDELALRDGLRCFAHGDTKHINELTIEHLLSFSQGGNDNNNNLVLVCKPANDKLSNLPLSQKIELIMQMRSTHKANMDKRSADRSHDASSLLPKIARWFKNIFVTNTLKGIKE